MKLPLVLLTLLVVFVSGCTASPTGFQETGLNEASLQVGLNEGNIAPDFSLQDIDGRALSRDSLKGKPAMLFFTTTWCTPCQVGASNLARYYDETGGKFNVAIIFVDPGEEEYKIRQFKEKFGRENWFMAYDNGMGSTYQVQYLDTKFALDKNSIIKWKNLQSLSYETSKQVMGALI